MLELNYGFPSYRALHKMGAEAGVDVVLVNPSEVVRLMKPVPYGKVTTLSELVQKIARQHGVRACCTLTSGILVTLAAKATEEAASPGAGQEIPYWRTLKNSGYLNPRYPGGMVKHRRLLEGEGRSISGKEMAPGSTGSNKLSSFSHEIMVPSTVHRQD